MKAIQLEDWIVRRMCFLYVSQLYTQTPNKKQFLNKAHCKWWLAITSARCTSLDGTVEGNIAGIGPNVNLLGTPGEGKENSFLRLRDVSTVLFIGSSYRSVPDLDARKNRIIFSQRTTH